MEGETRVPPDAGVNVFGKLLALLVGPGLVFRTIEMNKVWTRDHHLRGLALSCVHIEGVCLGRTSLLWSPLIKNVDDIVVRLVQLCLREIRKKTAIAAVTVDDQHLLAAIAGHLVGGLLQQGKLQAAAISHRSWLMLCLGNLTEVVFGKNDRVFLLGCVERRMAHIEEVSSERQVRAVFFEDPERKHARPLRALYTFAEI